MFILKILKKIAKKLAAKPKKHCFVPERARRKRKSKINPKNQEISSN